ncbi:uncharacterized protein AB675_2786 [Cyphellophora attinorum]|uniref:Cyanovirin-N domain-containing protein n=1 Tax=Cyphellophora attinorum TaxID=1664694 RepID=A0A0N0NR96_9EURO|nr:uncharacterized protein AB675_2786 [Phialophora attinorum]KPI44838.1 hypothetical protein AB675_2786 [Phialophora attinorum]
MSANDYYGGGSGSGNHQQGYGQDYNNHQSSGQQPFSPPPTTYTPNSSAQQSPYPGSAQPYSQQQGYGGYDSGYSNESSGYHGYDNTTSGGQYGYQSYDAQRPTPISGYGQDHAQTYDNRQYGGQSQAQAGQWDQNYTQKFGDLSLNDDSTDHGSSQYQNPPAYGTQDQRQFGSQAAAYPPASNYPVDPDDPAANPGDRGILGAIGGAAVGGFAGHKVNHGFLGAVGGAITGSLAEDALKKKHKGDKKDKKHKKDKKYSHGGRRDSSSSSSSSSSSDSDPSKKKHKHKQKYVAAGAVLRGNFSASSSNVYLEHRTTLVADCSPIQGSARRSQIDLNSVLTNNCGTLQWSRGGNFGASARNTELKDGGRVLEAELGDGRGGWSRSWIRLDERISNNDGRLIYLD